MTGAGKIGVSFLVGGILATSAWAQLVRVRDDVVLRKSESASKTGVTVATPDGVVAGGGPRGACSPEGFSLAPRAWHGQAVTGGGTLSPFAPSNPALINASGKIAFIASVNGSLRNQGCFTADLLGLHLIAMGCGGGGGSGNPGTGCGDPSPIGGTFSGFFGGTVFAPPINDAGDVLFFAEVNGGSSPRGLFLYRAATGQIIKIAAVGDVSPVGGTIAAVGPGSMNNDGVIVFLAKQSGSGNVNILKWTNGVVTKHVAVGDVAPGGGFFQIIAGESLGYADGTSIPIGDVPAINETGQVSFFATYSGQQSTRGLFVTTAGVHTRYVADNEPTPAGGTWFDFQSPMLNNAGEIAFLADVRLPGNQFTTGWFAGTPGDYRKALAFFDPVAGGQCWGLAFSRNPMHALDDCGNLLLWCVSKDANNVERDTTVISPASGPLVVIAQQGEATPIGGSFTGMQAWPSMNNTLGGLLSAFTPGAGGGALNTHFVFSAWDACEPCDANCDGSVNLFDIVPFIAVLEGVPETCAPCTGDTSGDGSVNLFDIVPFVECLS